MRKTVKKVLSTVLAAVLALGGATLSAPVNVQAAEDATAFLMFTDRDWAFGNWDPSLQSATTTVNGAGTYSVTLNAAEVGGDGTNAANGAMVFCVDIVGASADLAQEGKTYQVSDVKVTADGNEVAVDAEKVVSGDLEENGNYRIEIYNEYGSTAANSPIDFEGFTFSDTLTVDFTLEVVEQAKAFLMFTDRDGAFGNLDASLESATTAFTGAGSYTVTLNATEVGGDGTTPANGAMVFCVDIPGGQAALPEGQTYVLTALEVLCDNETIDADITKVKTGDIEENGNFRIEIYNEYGETAADSPIDFEGFKFAESVQVNFELELGIAGETPAEPETVEVSDVDLDGTYMAYIGLQSPTYSFRNAWDEPNYGLGTEYFNQLTGWVDGEAVVLPGEFTDVEIKGNGIYTVSATGCDFGADFDAQDHFNLIFVSTDIPDTGAITISDVKLKIDGKSVSIAPEINPDEVPYLGISIQNIRSELESLQTIGSYNVPPKDVEITFTVSGFNYDNPDLVAAEETTVAEETKASEEAVAEAAGDTAEESSGNTVLMIVVVAVAVVIIAVVAVVLTKKKGKKTE